MFQVFENDKPCDKTGFTWAKTWETSKFNTFQEALQYAKKWLGAFGENVDLYLTTPNVPYNYSGYGDMIVIKEI